jgi:hypothetical protein
MSRPDPESLTNESGSSSFSDLSATSAHEFNLSIVLQRLDQLASQHLASDGTQLVTMREFSALVEAVVALHASVDSLQASFPSANGATIRHHRTKITLVLPSANTLMCV